MNHKCPNTDKIVRIEKMLYGNGQPGLLANINRLDENVKALIDADGKLTTTVNSLVEFMGEVKTVEKIRKTYQNRVKWLITLFVSITIAGTAALITLIINLP